MLSLERINVLCQRVGKDLEEGPVDPFQAANVGTVLLLALGVLQRRVAECQLHPATRERVLAELAEARSALEKPDVTLHTAEGVDRRADLLDAQRLILDVTWVLLGAMNPG